jgi:DNA modification methylase
VIYTGDCLDILPTLDGESVQCCVTSPPYWGLRDYGTAVWEGGDSECDHKGNPLCSSSSSLAGYTSENIKLREFSVPMKGICSKCGATRIDSQIGLESTPEAYVEKLVAVFREVRRVLRDDGTLWLNLGDSYAGGSGGRGDNEKSRCGDGGGDPGTIRIGEGKHDGKRIPRNVANLKPKDLVGIPWRVAFALQADGWYLRQDIIWAKPNPMPESVTDRCTKAHEYIFLLTKSARYFYDAMAVKEDSINTAEQQIAKRNKQPHRGQSDPGGMRETTGGFDNITNVYERRNRRSVWTITTKPFKEAHFATFPPEIPEICIRAGSKIGDIILDPFSGAGTTGNVAERLGREYIGIELNPNYSEMGERRIEAARLPLFQETML